jgi:hypothetical protein
MNALCIGPVGHKVVLRGLFWQAWAAASILGLVVGDCSVARAFSEPLSYFDDAVNGGGGGRWFTGSPAEGYGCSVCHTGLPTQPTWAFLVEGLPAAGYVPGAVYDLRLSWPDFAARARQLRGLMGTPSMGVVAELASETGTASGSLDIDAQNPSAAEQCQLPPGMPGMDLYSVKPALSPAEGTSKVAHCDANKIGTRCLVTVRACGAEEVRMRWTAPAEYQGPIWFSAGFVATEQLSGTPDGDSVNEVTRPLLPATSGSARYDAQLHGGCSVARFAPHARTTWPAALALGWIWLSLRRARRTRRAAQEPRSQRGAHGSRESAHARLLGFAVASALVLGACASDHGAPLYPQLGGSKYPNVGLYTPGNTLGLEGPDAGTDGATVAAVDAGQMLAGPMGDRCVGASGPPGSAGTLTVDFSTAPSMALDGHWDPANVGAVWIQDAAGVYIKTIERWAALRAGSLYHWEDYTCFKNWPKEAPDAVTHATMPDHSQPHHSMWTGKDLNGKLVPDGKYVLFIEATETELNYGPLVQYEFDKGSEPQMLMPPDKPPHVGLKISYMPPTK